MVRSPRGSSHVVPTTRGPMDELASRCGPIPAASYTLGHESSGSLVGNPTPLAIAVAQGGKFALSAQYNQRHLGPFTVVSGGVRIDCSVDSAGAEGGPAAVLLALKPGTAVVSASTDDCSACAIIPVYARITITKS